MANDDLGELGMRNYFWHNKTVSLFLNFEIIFTTFYCTLFFFFFSQHDNFINLHFPKKCFWKNCICWVFAIANTLLKWKWTLKQILCLMCFFLFRKHTWSVHGSERVHLKCFHWMHDLDRLCFFHKSCRQALHLDCKFQQISRK